MIKTKTFLQAYNNYHILWTVKKQKIYLGIPSSKRIIIVCICFN